MLGGWGGGGDGGVVVGVVGEGCVTRARPGRSSFDSNGNILCYLNLCDTVGSLTCTAVRGTAWAAWRGARRYVPVVVDLHSSNVLDDECLNGQAFRRPGRRRRSGERARPVRVHVRHPRLELLVAERTGVLGLRWPRLACGEPRRNPGILLRRISSGFKSLYRFQTDRKAI